MNNSVKTIKYLSANLKLFKTTIKADTINNPIWNAKNMFDNKNRSYMEHLKTLGHEKFKNNINSVDYLHREHYHHHDSFDASFVISYNNNKIIKLSVLSKF